ncbi:hypothetical protein BDR22DRAFT_698590 [Usnea florida]
MSAKQISEMWAAVNATKTLNDHMYTPITHTPDPGIPAPHSSQSTGPRPSINLILILQPITTRNLHLILDPNSPHRHIHLLQTDLIHRAPSPHLPSPNKRLMSPLRPRSTLISVLQPLKIPLPAILSDRRAPPGHPGYTATGILGAISALAFGFGSTADSNAARCAAGEEGDEGAETRDAGADDAHGWFGGGPDSGVDVVPLGCC